MKVIASFLAIFLFVTSVNSQVKVYLRTGEFVNYTPEKNPNTHSSEFTENLFDSQYFLWLQFNQLPTEEKKAQLLQTGVRIYDYLPNNTFIASFPSSYNFALLKQYDVYAVTKPLAAAKIDASLYNPSQINWAVAANGNLKVSVSFSSYLSIADLITSFKNLGIQCVKIENTLDDIVTVEAAIGEIQKIAMHPLVQYIEPCTAPAVVEDLQGITNHRLTSVQTSDNWVTGKKLDGKDVVIAVGDDGYIGPHIDFQGRILSNATDVTAANTHADHVSGIIFGAGNLNPQVRGQAPGATLKVYDSYAPYNLFPSIYNSSKVRIVSHSLGQTCNAGYNSNARSSDLLIRTYPSLMYVHSAGNSGTSSCGGIVGWRNITGGYKAGKNVLTVANLSKTDVIDASSSRGPLPDGRIKPDIAAVGASVNSTQPDNTFDIFSGTSMACPAVAGNLAVLYQAYKNKNSGQEPEGSLIKAIALNTADDLGNPGPDFAYGWGRINVRKAVESIEAVKYFSDNISTGATKTFPINIPANVATAKIMIYWNDKEANAGAAKALVNNIDAIITDASSVEYYPWVLDIGAVPDASSVSNPAVYGNDSVNNMEQIQLDNPVAGPYTLTIKGKSIPTGPQKYYVVYEYIYSDQIVVTYPIGGESFAPSESQRLRWDAAEGSDNFKIEYSINNGTTWTTISSTVASERRYFDWSVPSTATSKSAKIRISRGAVSDESDTTFVILRIPTGVTFTSVCQGTTKISWNAVTGATSYDVCRLGQKYMDVVATTTSTNVTLNDVGDTLNWFAVRAKLDVTQANGRRSNALSHTNTSVVVCPVPVKLVSFIATVKNSKVQLDWVVANEENMLNYIVEKSSTPSFDKVETVGQIKPNNFISKQNYQLVDSKISIGTWYYRLKMVDANKALYSNIQAVKLDKNYEEHFIISPNPANNYIQLIAQNDVTNAVVKVYNGLGVEVISNNLGNAKAGEKYVLQTNNIAAGNYFINVFTNDKKQVVFKQMITVIK